ncbi:hypothetical protein NEUTE1DRAFT_118700 [Neurospora tetrasperma FGSC 2508]|uniref:Uncharacterized protein n=1 Tax=Neurospora tetrasperma (strain FGSC 2508 / ATCC MYA-4615 / P0657) TaxID=510951 RepID=F8N178_NEUT8|nr:uncharacterized protein NEUTE1DRAFT_118700 [Neurospora tetrasperma FGSC 2508]EGO52262.1 hypothetical protein NEUTE1DRAFT_118700 [Neurospora tetrasperma FGSC 2508]
MLFNSRRQSSTVQSPSVRHDAIVFKARIGIPTGSFMYEIKLAVFLLTTALGSHESKTRLESITQDIRISSHSGTG